MMSTGDDRFTGKTKEYAVASLTGKELRGAERDKKDFITQNRRELKKIVHMLTNLADRIPDIKKQIELFKDLLPTNRAVLQDELPDSINDEMIRLNAVADTISTQLGEGIKTEIDGVRTLLQLVLSNMPSSLKGVDKSV